jgi:hypothetical protein
MAINLRSPKYITLAPPSTSAYAILTLSVGQGTSTGTILRYTLRKNITDTSVLVAFEVSELLRDFLDINFDGSYNGQTIRVVAALTAYNSSDTFLTATGFDLFAFDSYSYFEESDFDVEEKSSMISNKLIFALNDNSVRIPINTSKSPVVTFLKDGNIVNTISYSSSNLPVGQIAYATVNATANSESYIDRVLGDGGVLERSKCLTDFLNEFEISEADEVRISNNTGSLEIIKIKTLQECKYEPKKFTFINKFGALQDIYFFKKQVNKMDVTKESYNANTLSNTYTYDRSVHTKRDFNIKAKESFTFSSGYLSEEYNEVFKQMMLSEKVWITNITETEEQVLPINVKTSNITYKTSLNDRLVEYTIEFENSYNVLNDIR